MSSLFNFDVEIDESWKRIGLKILTSQRVEFASAGLSIDWGRDQTLVKVGNKITINPPVKVTLQKWVFKHSAALNGVAFADDLSSVTADLSGAPDITIRLNSRTVSRELVP